MITTLNVNNFVGNKNWKSLQGDFHQQVKLWDQESEYYQNFIKEHIHTDEDIVFLHEVPYIKENENYPFKRSVFDEKKVKEENLKKSFLSFKQFCEENGYELLMNSREKTSYFVTLAIFKKGKYKRVEPTLKYKDYRNRILIVEKSENPDETLIAVHAPENKEIWETLISLFKELKDTGDRKILIVGDLNVYMPGTDQKHMFHQLLSEGMFDLWIESGKSHKDFTYQYDTRVDYCLVSDNGYDLYEIEKDDSVRLLHHSDHSCLMITKK